MISDRTIAHEILDNIPELVDYEILVSTPGVRESDSGFMWSSSFRAPACLNFIGESVYMNLFLPEGSEDDKEKKLFLTRINAKLQDGLWQARRNLDELNGVYSSSIKMAINAFRSLILDYTYILRGRYYAHFTFNSSDLADISSLLVSFADSVEGLRIEYMRRLGPSSPLFSGNSADEDVSAVTISITPRNGVEKSTHDAYFVMGSMLEKGRKTIARNNGSDIPEFFGAANVSRLDSNETFFESCNAFLNSFLDKLMGDFVVIYGVYGSAGKNSANVVITLPTQQTTPLLRAINTVVNSQEQWDAGILEISAFV